MGYLFIILSLVFLLVACTSGNQNSSQEIETADDTQETTSSTSLSDSLSNIMKLGGKYVCTFVSEVGNSSMYVQGENYRMEFEGQGFKSFVISKKQTDGGYCSFMWTDFLNSEQSLSQAGNTITKLCVTKAELEVDQNTQSGPVQGTPNMEMQVDCHAYAGNINLDTPNGRPIVDLRELVGQAQP